MARLTSNLTFTGSVGELTAYKRKGSDAVVLQQKAGPSSEQLKTSPAYANTRRNNAEFGGRSTATKYIRRGLQELSCLCDDKVFGVLNAWLKPIQELDTESEWGRRSVCLSKQPHLLAGFNLNRHYPFDSAVRAPMSYVLDRETLQASITIPALLPGINLQVGAPYPYYRLTATLAVVPDVFYKELKYFPQPAYESLWPVAVHTEWYLSESGSPGSQLTLQLPTSPVDAGFTLMLSIGICLGKVGVGGVVQQVKEGGTAKIVALV